MFKKKIVTIILLCLTTTLEYFDLYLYIHLPFVSSLFYPVYPETGLSTQQFFSAFNYSASFICRPLGALFWGYIGDYRGRKLAIIMASCMMIVSSLIMAILPTYKQVGSIASYIALLCRIMQGFSSLGAVIGAQLYLTEITKPPMQYLLVGILNFFTGLGPLMALSVSKFIIEYDLNWRIAFLLAASLTGVMILFRKNLVTSHCIKQHILDSPCQLNLQKVDNGFKLLVFQKNKNSKIDFKIPLAFFFIQSVSPVFFYFVFIYCTNILSISFGYTNQQVVAHNLMIALFDVLFPLSLAFLSLKVYPLKILKYKLVVSSLFIVILPFLLDHIDLPQQLFCIQIAAIVCWLSTEPANPIFYQYFNPTRRFLYVSWMFTTARSVTHVITSFGIVYLTQYFGHYGLIVIFYPLVIGYAAGLFYLKNHSLLSEHKK